MDSYEDFFLQDVCLNCDRATSAGKPYCTESCKIADFQKASAPSSPTFQLSKQSPSTKQSTWSSKRDDWISSYARPTTEERSSHNSYFMPPPSKESRPTSQSNQRSLTPSSSRSSLSSTTSGSQSNFISQQALQELREYSNAFEQAKASRRRQSTW
jgi:hypothetical protein